MRLAIRAAVLYFVWLFALTLFAGDAAAQVYHFKSFDTDKIQRQITDQNVVLSKAIADSERAKKEQAKRDADAAEARAKALREKEAAAKAAEAERQRMLNEQTDLESVRNEYKMKLSEFTKLQIGSAETLNKIKNAQDALQAQLGEANRALTILNEEKTKVQLQQQFFAVKSEQAENSSMNWFIGFIGSVLTGGVGMVLTIYQIIHLRGEIKREAEPELTSAKRRRRRGE